MLRVFKEAWADFRASLGNGEPTTPVAMEEPRDLVSSPPPDGATQPETETTHTEPRSEGGVRHLSWGRQGVAILLTGALVAVLGWQYLWPLLAQAEPADRNVVATYEGGVVTKEELVAELERHPDADRRAFASVAGLHHLVEDMVVHRVVERWAGERRLEDKSSVQHALKHVAEEVKLADIGRQVHEGQIRVDESEIQRYYEENRERFGDLPLAEARGAIRETLHASKERAYINEYLRNLRQSASVTIDDALLAVDAPIEADLTAYYAARQSEFREPEQRQVQELRFTSTSEREAKERAEKARARVTAGEDFATVAAEYGGVSWAGDGEWLAKGTRSDAFEANVWPLREGEISPIFPESDGYRLVRMVARRPERPRPFDEVREEIVARLVAEQTARQDAANRDKTLFTIRGRRFTLGEFLDEFAQLAPDVQARYRSPETRLRLVDGLIDRLILLDNASAQMLDVKNKREIEEARRHVLAQMLHEEDVQEKVTASEDEVRRFYDAHRSHYVDPVKVRISYIRLGAGSTADTRTAAQAKIAEAERRLKESGAGEESFASIAREVSEDPETAAKGGLLDRWLAQTDDTLTHLLAHDFVDKVFQLKVGQVSPVFFADNSFYLVRVRERTAAQPLSFEQAKARAREDLLEQKHVRVLDELEDELSRRMRLVVVDGRLQQVLKESGPVPGQ